MNLLKNLIALVIGCSLAFVILEIILNIYNPIEIRVKGNKIVLPINKKYFVNNNFEIKNIDKVIVHSKNSLGFRGEEIPECPDMNLKIITIGGSTTECFVLSDGKTWPDLLGNRLKDVFEHLWINNAGLCGHSTFGHIVLMKDYIVSLKPNIIIFLTGANDIGLTTLNANDHVIMKEGLKFPSIKDFIKSAANYSEIFAIGLNFYRNLKARNLGLEFVAIRRRFSFENFIQHTDEATNDEIQAIKHRHQKQFLPSYQERLMNLIDFSRKNGIEPIFLTQPALYGDFTDDLTGLDFGKTRNRWIILGLYNDIIKRIGESNNVLVIDLAKKMPKSTLYYYDLLHFNNNGAKKVAEIIFSELYPFLAKKFPKHLKRK